MKMPRHHADAIVLKRCGDLPSKIVAGRIRNRLLFEIAILLKRVVESLEKMRNPSDVVLDRYEFELGETFEHSGKNNFGERSLDRMMQRRVAFHHALKITAAAPLSQDMQADWRSEIVRDRPEWIV